MTILRALFTILFCFFFAIIFGQTHQCGFLEKEESINTQRLIHNKALLQNSLLERSNDITYIPIKFHLVARNNGTGRIDFPQVLDALCKLNHDFEPMDVQFYLHSEMNHINLTEMYEQDFPGISSFVHAQYQANKVYNAVNVFVGNDLSSGNSGYYTGFSDVIFMDQTYMTQILNILTHELGHYFSLRHTFWGWENTEYDHDVPTPTIVYLGNTPHEVEYVDREVNCEDAGDRLCSTPADYITSWNGGCDYTGGAVDPDSVLIDPDETNHMAYYSFDNCLEYTFTEEQMDVMWADYQSRPEISNVPQPDVLEIAEVAELQIPAHDTLIPTYNYIEMQWTAVPGATNYLVEFSPLASFAIVTKSISSETNTLLVSDLEDNKNYYWRVWAFNATTFCHYGDFSEVRKFKTGKVFTNLNENIFNTQVSIFPNPARDFLNIHFENDFQGEMKIQIVDVNGRLFFTEDAFKYSEQFFKEIKLNGFVNGVYRVLFLFEEKVVSKTFIIKQ